MTRTKVISTSSVEETLRLGQWLGGSLRPGCVIGLVGPLGVGKTHLVKGLAEGNRLPGTPAPEVTSPTFVLVNEYPGRVELFHLDAYRLHAGGELEDLGFEEMVRSGAVVVEWADRVSEVLPEELLMIVGTSVGPTVRRWTLSCRSQDDGAG